MKGIFGSFRDASRRPCTNPTPRSQRTLTAASAPVSPAAGASAAVSAGPYALQQGGDGFTERAKPSAAAATTCDPGAHAPAMRPWLPCQRHLSFRLWRHLQVVTFLGCLSHSVVILFCINIRIFISALKLPQACQILTHKLVRLEPQRSQ